MKQRALPAVLFCILTLAMASACDGRQAASRQPSAVSSQPSAVSPQPSVDSSQSPVDSSLPAADLWREPTPDEALATKGLLAAADAPERDLVDLASRLTDPAQPLPRFARDEPWGFTIGDRHDFWVQNKATNNYYQVSARLVYETPHAYWFVAEGLAFDGRSVHNAAERFEGGIYPTTRGFFGREWSPGVDSDPHLVILLTDDLGGGVSAYQNSLDEIPREVFPFSNEMEMITVSPEAGDLDDPAFDCTLAHEFQHVIQWAADRDEKTWVNEVLALLACPLNGLEAGYADIIVDAFAEQPDVQLNAWGSDPDEVAARYGASQLFGAYFLERFGGQGVKAWSAESQNGLAGLDRALAAMGAGLDGDDLFADWVAANYLDNPDLGDGQYGYRDLDVPPIRPALVIGAASLPVEERATVGQYAADTIVLRGPGDFAIDFAGARLARLVPAGPHSGDFVWWGGRDQESDATLSREFDLTGLDEATLIFHTWYDIDEGYDYTYVTASADGRQWTALPGQTTVAGNPGVVDLGPGYTGGSEGWIQERIDLTPYAGRIVQIRFEYVTDDGPVRPGFLLDDIAIPELDYYHDAESGDDGWQADGFLRQANVLPQEWLLQLITQRGNQVTVERLELDPDNSGRWEVSLGPGETTALTLSGITRETAEAAEYWLRVTE